MPAAAPSSSLALALVAAVALVCFVATPWVLRLLPEPDLATGDTKVAYRDLPATRLRTAAALWGAALAAATTSTVPMSRWSPFLVLALIGSIGCVIDAATTWLPRQILHAGWLLGATAVVMSTALAGLDFSTLGRAVAGALIGGGVMLVGHLVGGFGFSDVRLMVLVGGIACWHSWQTLIGAIVLGSLVGALWGLAHSVRHGRGTAFPYGPALLFGPYLALLLGSLR
jgi:leader peptidase (prepilin peptidase)/N-methyltransferase